MNVNVWKHAVGAARIAAVFTLTCALLMSGGLTLAHSNRGMGANAIEGTWFVRVTLRNCDSNAPLGSFNSLVTFHDGGTISETTSSPAFAIGQRSPGQGNWDFAGHRTYDQRMIALINFDTAANLPGTPGFNPSLPITPGFYAGWSTVSHTLTLTDANHASSSGTNAFYKIDGTVYRTGCSTAEATRFE